MARQFLRFALVGAAGFVADAAALYGLLALGAERSGARLLAFLLAATFTWICNRRFTFAGGRASVGEWLRYVLAMGLGGALNLGLSLLLLQLLPAVWWGPALAVGAGSIAGLALNFTSAKTLIFRHDRQE